MADQKYAGFADSNEALVLGILAFVMAAVILTIGLIYGGNSFGLEVGYHLNNWWSYSERPPRWLSVSFGVVITFSAFLGVITTALLMRGRQMETHVSGLQVSDAAMLNQQEKTGIKQTGRGVSFGGVTLSKRRETGHMLVLGLPGSGKTVLLNTIVKQIVDDIQDAVAENEKPDRLIIHDPKGDFTQWLPADLSAVFGPWDGRSVAWDIGRDVNTQALAVEAANAWITDSKDPMFSNAARTAAAGLIMWLQRKKGESWTLTDFSALLNLPIKAMCERAIEGWPANQANLTFSDEGEPITTTMNIITTMSAPLTWVHQSAAAQRLAKTRFSAREWLTQNPDRPILILKSDARYPAAAAGLFGLMMQVINNTICSNDMPEVKANEPGTWVILDEFPQLGKSTGEPVRTIQEFGRSRGARVITAAQDMSQYLDIYGRESGRVQTSLQQTVIYARQADESAKEISERSGVRIVNRWSGSVQRNSGMSESFSQAETKVILPHQLTRLSITAKGPEVIAVIEGQPGKLVVPFPQGLKGSNPQSVPNPAFDNEMVVYDQAETPEAAPKAAAPKSKPAPVESEDEDDIFKVTLD